VRGRSLFAADPSLAQRLARAFLAVTALVVATLLATGVCYSAVLTHFEPSINKLLAGKDGVNQTFRGMLDEETGLRGYIDTGNAVFLAPYHQGAQEILQGNAASAGLSTDPALTKPLLAMRAARQGWLTGWAIPALTFDGSASSADVLDAFLFNGKTLLDAYRATDDVVNAGVNAEIAAEQTAERDLVVIALGIALAVIAVTCVVGRRQHQALRAAVVAPISNLLSTMRRVGAGDFAARPASGGPPELRDIAIELGEMTAHLGVLLEQRATSNALLSRQALHDPLTDLANRTLLADRIGRALATSDASVTLLVAGVDHFKIINDALGHEVGDRLLRCLAVRLLDAIGPGDTLARFGGDEFAILVDHPATEFSVIALAEQLLRIAQEPIIIGVQDLRVTVSIGIAARAHMGDTPTRLMASADAALDDAKRTGRNRIVMSGVESRRRAEDRLALDQELRAGIPRHELVGYLQPVVNFASGAVDSAEMLVRWQHPTRGLLQPADFVPWAEESDLVQAIGAAILEATCTYVAARSPADRFVVSINAAAREIVDPGYADRTLDVLRRHGLPGSILGVEVTESVDIARMDAVLANLHALRVAGVKVYLDDFGTGYSSLGYLRQLPVDVLKIDRSFVTTMTTDPKAAEMVAAVAAMARAMSLATIAEGVETVAQAEALAALGINHGQGFLYAKPQAVADFDRMLASRAEESGWMTAARPSPRAA
jgi:diguanylate cyclase (GGDEF)-like protein